MKDFNRVLMVVNPISGGRDKSVFIEEVEEEVRRRGSDFRLFETSGHNDKEALKDVVKTYAPQRILSVGGDGTIKLIAEVTQSENIVIGIFPAGSANG
ncbi:MAG: diacylglycerol kinase family protein, partial [Salinimicrobium sediminis]|nr:diacylglycerol kinase family protein [Salinimicrobium sediminis]